MELHCAQPTGSVQTLALGPATAEAAVCSQLACKCSRPPSSVEVKEQAGDASKGQLPEILHATASCYKSLSRTVLTWCVLLFRAPVLTFFLCVQFSSPCVHKEPLQPWELIWLSMTFCGCWKGSGRREVGDQPASGWHTRAFLPQPEPAAMLSA